MRRQNPLRTAESAGISKELRRDEARELRRKGRLLREIADVVEVAPSTVSVWCQGIELTAEAEREIARRSRTSGPRDTQRRRRQEISHIRVSARDQVPPVDGVVLWTAGTVLYWGEGAKAGNDLRLANADPAALRLFMAWTPAFHPEVPDFTAKINLHSDNPIGNAIEYWCTQLGLESSAFTKPYIKRDGSGHRKNHLPWGVCQLRAKKSTDAFHRTMAWIDALATEFPISSGD